MVFVPTPAKLALKFPVALVTPVPLYVPPSGSPPDKAYVVDPMHWETSVPVKLTTGKEFTTTITIPGEKEIQPFASVT